jgi:excisionase family DNA binding protein
MASFLPAHSAMAVDVIRSDRSFLIDDAARLIGVSRRTIYYWIREGRLETIRSRGGSQRVLESSIERLRRQRQENDPATFV